MLFLANRANLDKRTLLTRIHNQLQTQVPKEDNPVEQVWYHTSTGNKVGVRATIMPAQFLQTSYPVSEAELQVSFDFPANYDYDFHKLQWVEPEREFMLGWHQDATHMDLGECHLQIDYRGETAQQVAATFHDEHPLNVFDQRIDDLVTILPAISWDSGQPSIPEDTIQ